MRPRALLLLLVPMIMCLEKPAAQRVYAPSSVLASGNWYRIGIKQEGIYKVDLALLSALGIPTNALSSASIRLYGNGGAMLPENNATARADDLIENPVEMVDGGDGIFNGADYFLFYAPGPDRWLKDSTARRFNHLKNIYSDTAYYYITIGGQGKRINTQAMQTGSNQTVTGYNARYFYENNLVNLLNSGKEWYGEEFNNIAAPNATRSFTVDWPGALPGEAINLRTDLAAKSAGVGLGFTIKANGQTIQTIALPAVTGNFLDPYAVSRTQSVDFTSTQSSISLNLSIDPVPGAQGWLNWFELQGRRVLAMGTNGNVFFRDWQSVGTGNIAAFVIGNAASASVWEITDPLQPVKISAVTNGADLKFVNDAVRLREYVSFTAAGTLSPVPLGKITNQDLHRSTAVKLIVITHPSLLSQAQKLAAYHLQFDNYKSTVVTTDQVYNEFSGGTPDPAAIRDFVKMYYDKANGDPSAKPDYLLLFGTGSYDYRSKNNSLVPVYESANSLDPLSSYTADDFFGLLDDADDISNNNSSNLLDIGIGRIPARDTTEAAIMVNKILRYSTASSQGEWRNRSVFVADDKDYNLHLTDAESIAASAAAAGPLVNQQKIYLDAYPSVSSSAGARYPAVNDAIVSEIFNGALLFNYSGHGNSQRLSEEAVLTQSELDRFNNPAKLPLFITASCDFAPHDDPSRKSLGAGLLTGSMNGGIALLTTTRLVFAYSNRIINDNYLKTALTPAVNGEYLTLGQSVMKAKNITSQNGGDLLNNRKFTLLGDPALRLAFPALRLQITAVNNKPVSGKDTLRALGTYLMNGTVTTPKGAAVNDFTGTLNIIIFDKPKQVRTLGNDPTSIVTTFTQQGGVLYKGSVSVTNGRFSFSFVVPKDINYQPGHGRISLYAANGITDATGADTTFYIGGSGAVVADTTGPFIQPFLNDDQFKNGGLTNENPLLLVKLYDSSGINTSGNSIGHDITAVIDGNENQSIVLNSFYTASLNSYTSGQVLFQLPLQTEGKHSIRIKAWDVANNSSEATLDYVVKKQEKLQVTKVHNFPNPFTGSTTFAFEHNQPGKDLHVEIAIYDRQGKKVKEIRQDVNTGGSRNCQIFWTGDTQSGAKITKGIYIYRVVVAADNGSAEDTQQLILF